MSAVEGGGSPVDWDVLAPHIDHPTRRRIVAALEEAGEPLSVRDLHERLADPELPKSRIGYHAKLLARFEVLEEIGEHVTVAGNEPVFDFPARP